VAGNSGVGSENLREVDNEQHLPLTASVVWVDQFLPSQIVYLISAQLFCPPKEKQTYYYFISKD